MVSLGCFLGYVVAGSWGAGAALRAAGSGSGGFRRAGRGAGDRGQAGEIAADPARGEPVLPAAALPGMPVVLGQSAGQAQLGDRADDDPGPTAELGRGTQGRLVPGQGGLSEPVGVLEVEAVQVAQSAQAQVRFTGPGPPQPQRPGYRAPVGKFLDGYAD